MKQKRITALLLCVVLMAVWVGMSFPAAAFTVTNRDEVGIVNTTNSNLNVRSGPGTSYAILGSLASQTVVTITGTTADGSGTTWYRIAYNGGDGYVSGDYIIVASSDDEAFELSISNFPESYKPKLRILHTQHPNWKFRPLMTGISWDTLLANECVIGRNLLYSPNAWKSFEDGAYDWANNTWYVFDSGGWCMAANEVIAYYLDPRNFLDSNIYQFLLLSNDGSNISSSVINGMLSGTFMYNADCGGMTYAEALIAAGREADVSPFLLAARIRQEQGTYGNQLAHGTVSGYEGYYNHFDINAYSHSGRTAMQNGAIHAQNKGWNTPYKAILGGAEFLGKNYIAVEQDTLYLQKFDVVDGGNGYYRHQYMTNVSASVSECSSLRNAIMGTAAENSALTFSIPVYNNMPEAETYLPLRSGDANNLLSSLSVDGHSISPSFNKYTTSYSMTTDQDSVYINASASNRDAAVFGNGNTKLTSGVNKINIVVTATNGLKRTYTLTINCTIPEVDPLSKEPPILSANVSNGTVNLNWTVTDGATGYVVYRAVADGDWEELARTEDLSYTDTNAPFMVTCRYAVQPYRDDLYGEQSDDKTVVLMLATPTVTSTATASGASVNWNAITGATSYRVYRRSYSSGKWSGWKTLGIVDTTSYTDKTMVSGTQYQYTVRAQNGDAMSNYKAGVTLLYLAMPTVTSANAAAGVSVNWNAITGATSYRVYRRSYSSGKWSGWKTLGIVSTTSYTDKAAVSGAQYQYTVRAQNGDVMSNYKAGATLLYLATPTVTSTNAASGVSVKWNAITGATSYRVYRRTYSSGKWSGWKTLGIVSTTSYTDKAAVSGVQYQYTVRAQNGDVMSNYTAGATLERLAQPSVTVKKASKGFTASWKKVTGATGYRVYRRTYSGGKWSGWQTLSNTTALSYTDKTAKAGVQYQYTVRAYNGSQMSSYQASATVKR